MLYITVTDAGYALTLAKKHVILGWREVTHSASDLSDARRKAWLIAEAFVNADLEPLPFWEQSA
jgi:hypothetical protein